MAECSSSNTKWACSRCTYLNFKTSLKCTVCLTPQRSVDTPSLTIEQAAAGFSGGANNRDVFPLVDPADAVAGAGAIVTDDERWSCPACTYFNCLRTKKCVQCGTDRPLRYVNETLDARRSSRSSSPRITSPPQQSSPQSTPTTTAILAKALNKWSCTSCTFHNWPNAARCTMCGAQKASPSRLSPDSSSHADVAQNAGKKSRDESDVSSPQNVATAVARNIASTEHYTSALDIYLRRFAANDAVECAFFKAAANIGRSAADIEAVNSVLEYLINEGNVQRRFSSFEARLLNLRGFLRAPPFEAGDSLVEIAKRGDSADLVKLMRRCVGGESDGEKLACAVNCASRNRIYAKVAQSMAVRNGNFNAQFIAHPYNFSVLKFPMIATDYNLEIMKAILKPAPSVPPTYCFADCYDTRGAQNVLGRPPNFLLKNRGGGYSLCDSLFQSMFGVCDRYNILRTALKYTMLHSDHCFKPRWREYYTRMARDCGITLSAEDVDNDWEEALNAASNEDDCLEPIHIFVLAHVICRPIVVVSMNAPVELDELIADLHISDDETSASASQTPQSQKQRAAQCQQRSHAFEGVYLPVLWASPPVSRSPIVIAFRNGLFYAVIVSDALYQRDQEVQRYLKLNCPRRNGTGDNPFRFLTIAELGNSNLLAQFVSMAIYGGGAGNYIAIRRDPHPFLYESLLFYTNWTCAVHCCDVENSGDLKMSQLERYIDAPFDLSQLRYGGQAVEKFSIFSAKALSVLRRNRHAASLAADTSVSEPIVMLDSDEEDDEEEDEDDDEEEEDNESLADVPA